MRKSLIKIILILLMISLSWIGLSAVSETFAFYKDDENSLGNSYSAGSLDFSIPPTPDFSPEVLPTQSSTRTISLENNGSLGFQYTVQTTNATGSLCEYLNLTADLDGINKYTGALTGFDVHVGEFSSSTDDWQFTVSLAPDTSSSENQVCTFDFVFEGWQTNIIASSTGFTDIEKITNTITTGVWTPEVTVKSPNGGEIWYLVPDWCPNEKWCSELCQALGMNEKCEYPIKWTATNEIGPDTDLLIDIYFSTDSGNSWMAQIANDTDNDGIFYWKLPYDMSYVTEHGRIKVEATHKEYSFLTSWDMSDADFCPPLLTLEDLLNWEEQPVEEESMTGEESATEEPADEEVPADEEISVSEEKTIITEGEETEEETAFEETTEEITEDSTVKEEPIVEKTLITEEELIVGEEPAEEPPFIEVEPTGEAVTIEEAPADETPRVEEQPATLPDDSSSTPDGAGESGSDGESSDGGGDTSGSSDGGSPAEGIGGSSGESGDAGQSVSE